MFFKYLVILGIAQTLLVHAAYYPPGCTSWPAGVPESVNGVKRPPFKCGGGPQWPPEQGVISPVTVVSTVTLTQTIQLPPEVTRVTFTSTSTVYQVAPTELAHAAAFQCSTWFTDGSRPVPVFDLDGQPQCCLPHPDQQSKIFGDCRLGPRV